MHSVRQLQVFIASPEDVKEERKLACQILNRLPNDPLLGGRVVFKVVAYDHPDGTAPLLANMTPQESIRVSLPKPSECDAVIIILWARMGTPLPDNIRKEDGSVYLSGTEWEFEDALRARRPIYVYRRAETPSGGLDDPKILMEKLVEYEKVQRFFSKFVSSDRSIIHSVKTYSSSTDFSRHFENDMKHLIKMIDAEPEAKSPNTERKDDPSASSFVPRPVIRRDLSISGSCHPGGVLDLAYTSDGQFLVSSGTDGKLRFWESSTGISAGYLEVATRPVCAISFNASGTLLAAASLDGGTVIVDSATKRIVRTLAPGLEPVMCTAFCPSNPEYLATAGHGTKISIWNTGTGECADSWETGQSVIYDLAFSSDGRYLASAGRESVKVWTMPTHASVAHLHVKLNTFQSIRFAPKGDILAAGGRNARIFAWNTGDWALSEKLERHSRAVFCIRFSPSSALVASAGADGRMSVTHGLRSDSLHSVSLVKATVTSLAFHPDATLLASGSNDGAIHGWRLTPDNRYSPRFLRRNVARTSS